MTASTLPEQPNIAVVGATGAVGTTIFRILAEREFPYNRVTAVASAASRGETLEWQDGALTVRTVEDVNWKEMDLALMSAGSTLSTEVTPSLREKGVRIIDNSSAHRLKEGIPLVVPEINWQSSIREKSVIANPNCSATQLTMGLAPLENELGLHSVSVSTYQSVSGAGGRALEAYRRQRGHEQSESEEKEMEDVFRDPIDEQILPLIPHGKGDEVSFGAETGEEMKVREETRKILFRPDLSISVTCARVPVPVSHAQAVHLSLEEKAPDLEYIHSLFDAWPGVEPVEKGEADYTLPGEARGTDPVYVGRLRRDPGRKNGIALWTVSDNLRKGAALNTVQIAERLLPGS